MTLDMPPKEEKKIPRQPTFQFDANEDQHIIAKEEEKVPVKLAEKTFTELMMPTLGGQQSEEMKVELPGKNTVEKFSEIFQKKSDAVLRPMAFFGI